MIKKLLRKFYTRDANILARELLGKVLVHSSLDGITSGIIVETEAYKGPEDKAAHSYNNKRTSRTEIMFADGGFDLWYVFMLQRYGQFHWKAGSCVNSCT